MGPAVSSTSCPPRLEPARAERCLGASPPEATLGAAQSPPHRGHGDQRLPTCAQPMAIRPMLAAMPQPKPAGTNTLSWKKTTEPSTAFETRARALSAGSERGRASGEAATQLRLPSLGAARRFDVGAARASERGDGAVLNREYARDLEVEERLAKPPDLAEDWG